MKLLLFAPRMAPLAHIHTYVDNKASQVWANRGSSKTDLYVGLILRKLSLAESRKHIYTFVGRVPGEDKKMADAALRFTHLPNRKFLSHFRTHSPQSKPWILPPLPSVCRQQLTTMLHNMQSRRVSPQPSSRRTPSPGSNSDATAAGYKFPPTSKALKTPFLSSRFLPVMSILYLYLRKGYLSRINWTSNTSARSVKYSHRWGPTTQATTAWGNSNFGLDVI